MRAGAQGWGLIEELSVLTKFVGANLATWDAWAELHATAFSATIAQVLNGKPCLTGFETGLLGDLAGQKVAHLQCHLGVEAISLRLLGAASVTGIDFSEKAISIAKKLAGQLELQAISFEVADASALPARFANQFDTVFVNTGSLCWLPRADSWARGIASCLKSNGRLVLFEVHPLLYAADVSADAPPLRLSQDYFEGRQPHGSSQDSSYASGPTTQTFLTYEWNHSISEVLTSLTAAGLAIEEFREVDFVNWRALPWLEQAADGFWRAPAGRPRLPLSYAVIARRSPRLSVEADGK
jgi:SAM-dependent methyltransferase